MQSTRVPKSGYSSNSKHYIRFLPLIFFGILLYITIDIILRIELSTYLSYILKK